MFETVVIATDGSDSVERAIEVGVDVADRFDAALHAVTVVDASEVDASPEQLREEFRAALETRAETALQAVERHAGDRDLTVACLEGRPASELCQYARRVDADVLVSGTRGRHGENRLLLGSVAERLVRTAPVPVLTVRQLAADETEPVARA